ncbi:hypothetical protein ACIQNG_20815 [Streptomyces sp. NPDC091377]|uniref:hypothetical protein n=1 Tax=Streptomyces sp. NPDC091377 TaxID=3365995 RepID=UPI003802275E
MRTRKTAAADGGLTTACGSRDRRTARIRDAAADDDDADADADDCRDGGDGGDDGRGTGGAEDDDEDDGGSGADGDDGDGDDMAPSLSGCGLSPPRCSRAHRFPHPDTLPGVT